MKRIGSVITWPFSTVFFGVLGETSIIVGAFILLTVWTERSLEFWLSHWKGSPVDVPFWMAFVLSLVLNVVVITANIISELVRLAI